MGAEPSKEIQKTCGQGNRCGPINDFPNIPIKDREIPSWSLLHQCTLDNWKQGHAGTFRFICFVPISHAKLALKFK